MTDTPLTFGSSASADDAELALLGLIAYQELTSFEHLSSDARLSPTLVDREILGRLAVAEFGHFELVRELIAARGLDPQEVIEPFMESLDEMHRRTKPGDWYESLTKAYVIDGVAGEFYSLIASGLEPEARDLVHQVKRTEANADWLRDRLQLAIADHPERASRMALWGRRLLGEALTQAREIGEKYDYFGALQAEGRGDRGQEMTTLFASLVESHSRRMRQLGMTA